MTRAKDGLYLSWVKKRLLISGTNNKGRLLELPPSRFLSILADIIPLKESENRKPAKSDPQLTLFSV
jgi:superfamily I DNA/RNA helicase